jgi:outer membrane protein OmpA-like peptidoglycan-associated protein
MYADLKFDFEQMDLTAASPYSGRYVGRTISQGKLSIKTTYRIEHDTLKADHDIRIDQFNFGQHVDSPDDLDLPVDLAVALLKDRSGEIHIELPVSGNLDDPQFSIGGIVLHALVNLIVKAVTSPFALLGSMFQGENPDHLAFEPGSARFTADTTQKLDALIKILYDRPALQLEISGYADQAGDTPALVEILFQRKLQAQKALQLADEGKVSPPLEDIVITPEEHDDLLQAAYEAETFDKPTNFIGMEKTLPPKEAEDLIRQHIVVGPPELEALAYARAQAVKDYLLDSGQVEAERVFLVKPENALAPEVAEGLSPGCVLLGLK